MRKRKVIIITLVLSAATFIAANAESIINVIDIKNPRNEYVFIASNYEQAADVQQVLNDIRKQTPNYNPARPYSEEEIVMYATKFLGTPYEFGAEGPNRFDCSGFVKYVYRHFGIDLPRVSVDQAKVGMYVAKNALRPGDLVFFAYDGTTYVHHVGIYIGEGMFIHAPQTGDVVKISSLSRRTDFFIARRYK